MEEKLLPTEAQCEQAIQSFDAAWKQLIDLGFDMRFHIGQDHEFKTISLWLSLYQPVGEKHFLKRKSYGEVSKQL